MLMMRFMLARRAHAPADDRVEIAPAATGGVSPERA
jgi:hypothetical protein